MGLIKKKVKKILDVPKAPLMSFEVAMHNTTTITADDKGEYCHALFQTDKTIAPADWEALAQHARKNARFVITVMENESTDDD